MSGTTGAILWLILAVILFVIEGMTVQLVTVWFAVGALAAGILAFFGASVTVQLLVFLGMSVIVLIIARPLIKDVIAPKKEATNADRAIGQVGVVTETVDNIMQTGRVTVLDLSWMARTDEQVTIPPGNKVWIKRIEGAKVIVEPIWENRGVE